MNKFNIKKIREQYYWHIEKETFKHLLLGFFLTWLGVILGLLAFGKLSTVSLVSVSIVSVVSCFFVVRLWGVRNRNFEIKIGNTTIEVVVGDLLNVDGDIAIVTNTTFDLLDSFIHRSLLRKAMEKFIPSNYKEGTYEYNALKTLLDEKVASRLSENKVECEKILHNTCLKNKKYPVGTYADIVCSKKDSQWHIKDGIRDADDFTLFLVAMVDLDETNNCRPDAKTFKLRESIEVFFRSLAGGNRHAPLNLPVMGTGMTGINTPAVYVIEEILDAYFRVNNDSESRPSHTLRIVISEKDEHIWKNDGMHIFNILKIREKYQKSS